MFKNIQLDAPCLGPLEKQYLDKAIDSGFVSSTGPFIADFERKMAEYLQVAGAVAVQSGTAAIYLGLHELGIGPGDEVIVPALTFAASVNPVLYAGARPVIVDVDVQTWNMDPAGVEKAITSKTKAIVPVHLYGNPCDMDVIMGIARKHNVHVVEDATEGLGGTFGGRQAGTFGALGCFSFNGNKLITTGGGGMVVGNDLKRLEHIRYLANQAKDKDLPGIHSEMGFNYRMTNIEAALGLAQFEQIHAFLEKKKAFMDIYREILSGISGVNFQQTHAQAMPSGWMTCLTLGKTRPVDAVIQALKDKGIPTRRVFMPVHDMPYLKVAASAAVAKGIYNEGLCLPSSTTNDAKDIRAAALAIREVLTHG